MQALAVVEGGTNRSKALALPTREIRLFEIKQLGQERLSLFSELF
jgi:hypothetical protein